MSSIQGFAADTSRLRQRIASITTSSGERICLNYIDGLPPGPADKKGMILPIHGFPQTSYQFRHVMAPLADAGYRVIAPDYRGAGQSSKPLTGYRKTQMAEDLHILIQEHFRIKDKIHVVGHDIGGMIAYAYATRYSKDVASVIWGECPLPGSSCYESVKGTPDVFHFVFYEGPDLPEALIAGKGRKYLKHFFDNISYNSAAISPANLNHYTLACSRPGAIRAGLEVYRAFANMNSLPIINKIGSLDRPCSFTYALFSSASFSEAAEGMASEFHEGAGQLQIVESAHYNAEENPEGFVAGVIDFVSKH